MTSQAVTIDQANFNFMKSKGANTVLDQLSYETWMNDANYRNHWVDAVNKIHNAGMFFILSCAGKILWGGNPEQEKYDAVYNGAARAAWINAYRSMIQVLQPDGVDPMNEPCGDIPRIAANDLKNFYLACYDSWIAVKPDLFFCISGTGSWSTTLASILTSPRLDESRPNSVWHYNLHYYYFFNGPNPDGSIPWRGDPDLEAYWRGDLAAAKTLLHQHYDSHSDVLLAQSKGVNILFQEFGGHILNPNVTQFMQDTFDYAKARGIGVLWVAWDINSHALGWWGVNLIDDWTPTLNILGLKWAENMYTAPPPQYNISITSNPSNIPFTIVSV